MSFTPSENPITHPERESYTELRPFRFWCQKVLPLVYDDSLSYYELLCKVVDYLNRTMEDVDHMNTDMDTLYSNFQEFQEGTFRIYNELVAYVNAYFENLDVQEEINNKLDDMVTSGELVTILQPSIAAEVSSWLAEHITETTPAIDNTLTIEGAGADSATTGHFLLPLSPLSFINLYGNVRTFNGSNTPVITEEGASFGITNFNDITATSGTRAIVKQINSIINIPVITSGNYKMSLFVRMNTNSSVACKIRLTTGVDWSPLHNVLEAGITFDHTGFYNLTLSPIHTAETGSYKYLAVEIEQGTAGNISFVGLCFGYNIDNNDKTLSDIEASANSKIVGDFLKGENPCDLVNLEGDFYVYNGSNVPVASTENGTYGITEFRGITAASGTRAVVKRINNFINIPTVGSGETLPISFYVHVLNNDNLSFTIRLSTGSNWASDRNVVEKLVTVNKSGVYSVELPNRYAGTTGYYRYFIVEFYSGTPTNINFIGFFTGLNVAGNDNTLTVPGLNADSKTVGDFLLAEEKVTNLLFTDKGYVYNGSYSYTDTVTENSRYIDGFDEISTTGFRAVGKILNDHFLIPSVAENETFTLLMYVSKKSYENVEVIVRCTTGFNWATDRTVAECTVTLRKPGFYALQMKGIRQPNNIPYNVIFVQTNGNNADINYCEFYTGAVYKYGLVCWGDSLTAGAGGNGTTYPNVCANILKTSVLNMGVGGENADTIASRMGANNVYIERGTVNKTYANTVFKDEYNELVNPLRQGSAGVNPIFIDGYPANLSITQTGYTGDATYTISGYAGSNLAMRTPVLFNGYNVEGDVTVIFVGQNGPESLDVRLSLIDSMISRVKNKQYVVMGLTTGTAASRASEEATYLEKYGNHYLNTRKAVVADGLNIAGITPTAEDTSAISAGSVPPSLLSDNVHFNATGYTVIGKILANKIKSLGY